MKLSECNASIFGDNAGRKGLGLMLECPICVKTKPDHVGRAWIPVRFENPVDGGPPVNDGWTDKSGVKHVPPLWKRTGDTLETLTLSPSLDASSHDHDGHKGWHGHIQNGQIVGGL